MICIYQIRNLENNKIYIGSTKNFNKRKVRHIRDLKKGSHHCIYLQRAYNKSFLENFVFEILEECLELELFTKEQFWIDRLNPDYNIGAVGGGDNFTNHPEKDKIYLKLCKQLRDCKRPNPRYKKDNPNWKDGKSFFTCPICNTEIKRSTKNQKSCNTCKDMSGKNNPFYGKEHSDEIKEKIRQSKIGKPNLSCSKRCSINGVEYPSVSIASKKINVKPATVAHRLRSKNEKFKNWYYI